MDALLKPILEAFEAYVAGLIDAAAMPEADRVELKEHLQAAEVILLRNGRGRLGVILSRVSGVILGRVQ